MLYTVSDFLNTYASSVRLVAGQGGLSRAVGEVGILDYELVPGLKSHYQRTNFYEGQLVLSSFLYARDNPYLITEAVKYLVSVGASGLVIKNVFHLELPDAALRYANARNLPLMLVTTDDLFFDNVIIDVGTHVRELEDSSYAQHELDSLLLERDDPRAVRERALRLNPSLGEEYVVLYAPVTDGVTQEVLAGFEARYRKSPLFGAGNLLCAFDDGLLVVVSGDSVGASEADAAVRVLRAEILDREVTDPVGQGEPHHDLGEFGNAILEAVHAAGIAALSGGGVVRHADLGVLRVLLPHVASPAMASFSKAVLAPLRDFDAENNAQLETTLDAYLGCGRSIGETAERLGTHPNTVRYRMGQIAQACGLDWRVPDQMEQLSLAHAIEFARVIAGDRGRV